MIHCRGFFLSIDCPINRLMVVFHLKPHSTPLSHCENSPRSFPELQFKTELLKREKTLKYMRNDDNAVTAITLYFNFKIYILFKINNKMLLGNFAIQLLVYSNWTNVSLSSSWLHTW